MMKQITTMPHLNFKCGEVVCTTPTEYNVDCCVCKLKIDFEAFPKHFRENHLELLEDIDVDNNLGGASDDIFASSKAPIEELVFEASDMGMVLEEEVEQVDCAGSSISKEQKFLNTLADDKKSVLLNSDDDDDEENIPLAQRKRMTYWETKWAEAGKQERKEMSKRSRHLKNKENRSNIKPEAKAKKSEKASKTASDGSADIKLEDGSTNEQKNNSAEADFDDFYYNDDDEFRPGFDDYEEDDFDCDPNSFKCTLCSRKFETEQALCGHMNKHREGKIGVKKKRRTGPKKPKEFKCDFEGCDAEFYTEFLLSNHKYKHTGLICDVCGATFTQVGTLVRHKVRHTGIKAYKCENCDDKFYTNKDLRRHAMKHSGYMPAICEVCGKSFYDNAKLREHMRRHTGERPYKCDVCDKCFFTSADLKSHMVTHTSNDFRPFTCHCGATTKTKKALRVHQKTHETVKPYQCSLCGKSFAIEKGLKFHMYSHSNVPTSMTTITTTRIDSIEEQPANETGFVQLNL